MRLKPTIETTIKKKNTVRDVEQATVSKWQSRILPRHYPNFAKFTTGFSRDGPTAGHLDFE
jgi:hypothetical protein